MQTFLAITSALGSLVTVVVALVLLKRQAATLDLQRRSAIDGQAHRVTAWAEMEPLPLKEGNSGQVYAVHVINSGDEAVYALTVVQRKYRAEGEPERKGGASPGLHVPAQSAHRVLHYIFEPVTHFDFEVQFMDSRGNHWARSRGGTLRRLDWPYEGTPLVVGAASRKWWQRRPPDFARQRHESRSTDY